MFSTRVYFLIAAKVADVSLGRVRLAVTPIRHRVAPRVNRNVLLVGRLAIANHIRWLHHVLLSLREVAFVALLFGGTVRLLLVAYRRSGCELIVA